MLPIHYLALHEIFPTGAAGALLAGIIYSGFIGFLMLLVMLRRWRSSSDRRKPPVRLILAGAAMFGWLPLALMGEGSIGPIEWIVSSLWVAGNMATVWWLWDKLSPHRPVFDAPKSTPPPPPETEIRTARDACAACQASAAAGGGPPLSRIAHKSEGPRFLYRCAECHSYWEKDVKGMRPISLLRVRQEFPALVV